MSDLNFVGLEEVVFVGISLLLMLGELDFIRDGSEVKDAEGTVLGFKEKLVVGFRYKMKWHLTLYQMD